MSVRIPEHGPARGDSPRRPLRRMLWLVGKQVRRDRAAVVGSIVALVLLLAGISAPLLAPHSPLYQFPDGLTASGQPLPPGPRYWLGTDPLGRDLLSRLLYGVRVSLTVGLVASALALGISVALGLVAGHVGGLVAAVILRVIDAMLSIPSLLFMIALVAVAPRGQWVVVVVIAAFSWAYPARVFYSQVLSLKQRDFVEAARCLGAGTLRILGRHLLPQLIPLVIVYYTLRVPQTILAEAGLSFLGLGIQPPPWRPGCWPRPGWLPQGRPARRPRLLADLARPCGSP
jgi:peptide/nickel transport system permease protein